MHYRIYNCLYCAGYIAPSLKQYPSAFLYQSIKARQFSHPAFLHFRILAIRCPLYQRRILAEHCLLKLMAVIIYYPAEHGLSRLSEESVLIGARALRQPARLPRPCGSSICGALQRLVQRDPRRVT